MKFFKIAAKDEFDLVTPSNESIALGATSAGAVGVGAGVEKYIDSKRVKPLYVQRNKPSWSGEIPKNDYISLQELHNQTRGGKKPLNRPIVGILRGDEVLDSRNWNVDLSKYTKNKVLANFTDTPNVEDKWKFYEHHGQAGHMPKTLLASNVKDVSELQKAFPQGYVAKKRLAYAGKGLDVNPTANLGKYLGNSEWIFQEKLNLPKDFSTELRVTVNKGSVIDIMGRKGDGVPGYDKPIDPKLRQEAKSFSENFARNLKVNREGIHNLDVVKDLNGRMFVIESNLANGANMLKGTTHQLNAQLNQHMNTKGMKLLGKAGKPLIGLGAVVGTGALGKYLYEQKNHMKTAAKDKRVDQSLLVGGTLVGAGTISAGIPVVKTLQAKAKQPKVDKIDPKKILILTEGGHNVVGGRGHEAPARALALEAIKKGYDPVIVTRSALVNSKGRALMPEMDRVFNKAVEGNVKKNYAQRDSNWARMGLLSEEFNSNYDLNNLKKIVEREKPARIITTFPMIRPALERTGIKPEMVHTDYGLKGFGQTAFWTSSKYYNNPDNIQKIYTPAVKDVKQTFPGIPINELSAVPFSDSFTKAPSTKPGKVNLMGPGKNSSAVGSYVKKPGERLVVITGGGMGQNVDEVATALSQKPRPGVKYLAVAGGNIEAYNKVKGLNRPDIMVTGFTKEMPAILDQADAVIARPHANSPTEILLKGKPMASLVHERDAAGKFLDKYDDHMVENAKYFNNKAGSPIINLYSDGKTNKLNTAGINNTVDELLSGKHTPGVENFNKFLRTNNPSVQILEGTEKITKPNYLKDIKITNAAHAKTFLLSGAAAIGVGAGIIGKRVYNEHKKGKT